MSSLEQTALLTRGRTTAKVLALLTSTPGQRFHTREIVRRIEGTEHPVHRALTLLEAQGLVDSQRVGNLRMWSMPTTHPLYRGLREVFARTVGVTEQLRSALEAAFQILEDGTAAVIAVEFRPDGASVTGLAQFRDRTSTAVAMNKAAPGRIISGRTNSRTPPPSW